MQDVGWRERIRLPEFSKKHFKVKMDTGAKTSSLHVKDLVLTGPADDQIASFKINVGRRSKEVYATIKAPVVEIKRIKSSNGEIEDRPTIRTNIEINGIRWPIDVTLTDRSKMKYRMLIGRDAMSDRLRVCPSKSYLLGG